MAEFVESDAPCTVLEWDTSHFGFPIGRVVSSVLSDELVMKAEAWCELNSIRCLYLLVDTDDFASALLAQRHRFQFVDVRLDLEIKLSASQLCNSFDSIPIDIADPADLPALELLAECAHRNTRFFSDDRFPAERSGALYRHWIGREVSRHQALVARSTDGERAPLGYITTEISSCGGHATIGLLAVSELARGRGVGRALLEKALSRAQSQNVRTVSVTTQGANVAAQKIYQAAGFRSSACRYWFHRWFP